jgi:hypothetical protein
LVSARLNVVEFQLSLLADWLERRPIRKGLHLGA